MSVEKGLRKMLEIFGLRKKDGITVVFTPESRYLAEGIREIAKNEVLLLGIPHVRDTEALNSIKERYIRSRNIVLLTKESMTHHILTQAAKRNGAKVISVPNPEKSVFERAARFDYGKIERISLKVRRRLARSDKITITSGNGTDFTLRRGKRPVKYDEMKVGRGNSANFPTGEVFFAPVTGSGTIYFDRVSYEDRGVIRYLDNAGFIVKRGKLAEPLTSEGRILWDYLSAYKGFETIAEFAVGTNPYAKFEAPIVEAEKVLGQCHVAFGEARNVGGTHAAEIHKDGLIKKPTVWLDGKPFIENGKLKI